MKNACMAYLHGTQCVYQNKTYVLSYVSKVAIKQYIRHSHTLNSKSNESVVNSPLRGVVYPRCCKRCVIFMAGHGICYEVFHRILKISLFQQ